MAYEKIGFNKGDVLKAEHLNHIEDGIGWLSEEIASDEYKKAVAALVPIVKVAESPVFVNSVADMIDTDKPYVLTADGMIYAHGEKTQTIITEAQNRFDPSKATISSRLSSSSGSVSGTAALGSFVTDFIPVTGFNDNNPFNVELNFEAKLHGDDKFCLFNSSKTFIKGATFCSGTAWLSNVTVGNGKTIINIRKDNSGNAITDASVAYIRLQVYMRVNGNNNPATTALTADEIKNVTIKYQHESSTKTETVAGFFSTGIVYNQPADYENRVIALETDVANNAGNIAMLQQRVGNLENGEAATVIPTFWESAVSECIAKIKALQVGRNCVTFPFFSDNHQRNGYAGVLIAKVMEECNIPYCFYGGDSISSGTIVDEAEMIAQDKAFDTAMSYIPNGRLCRAVGNHDGYWYDGTNKFYYTRDQVYELFLREESIAQNKHFGDDGTYYYIDDIASKVRFVVLNTNGGSVDATQIAWIKNTALALPDTSWAVVFFSHHPISNIYTAGLSNASEVIAAVKSKSVEVIGWYSGHVHRDRMNAYLMTGGNDTTEGTATSTALGFTQVTITSDNTSIAYKNDDGTDSSTKHPTGNDDQSHAIDFVTINKTTRTVNLTRLGIGSDRSYTY